MDAFHAFLAAPPQSKAVRPSTAPQPPAAPAAPPEPAHIALFRHWRARWQAQRRAAAAASAALHANPATNPDLARLAARLELMAQRLHAPRDDLPEFPEEEEYQTPLPPPDYISPRARRAPGANPIPEGAWLIHDENRPANPPGRLPKITAKPQGRAQEKGRGGKAKGSTR